MRYSFIFLISIFTTEIALAKNSSLSAGSGLQARAMEHHDFLYAGEWQNSYFKDQQTFIVKDGKIVWSYTMGREGEYGDATLLLNGDILFHDLMERVR